MPYGDDDMNNLYGKLDHDIEHLCYNDACSRPYKVSIVHVMRAIARLKGGKTDGCVNITSYHLINAGPDLSVHISFTVLSNGVSLLCPRRYCSVRKRRGEENLASRQPATELFPGFSLSCY